MPGNPTVYVKPSAKVSREITLDEDETRQLIGWSPPHRGAVFLGRGLPSPQNLP
jgi:hypothetical protein